MIAYSSNALQRAEQLRPLRVLMIEDDKYYFAFVKQLLMRRSDPGFELEKASTLKEGIARLQEESPDLILLDLNLPDADGMECLEKVKEASDGCPIVVLTSADDDALGLMAVASGAHDYLVKQNVGNDSLVRCIRYAIERRRSEEQTLRLAAIEDFVATLAHDMRVPLLSANKLLDNLLSGSSGELSTLQKQLVDTLRESTRNQLQLVQRLIEVYRYESGTNKLHFDIVSLAELIEKSISSISAECENKIVFENNLPPTSAFIRANAEALERLFNNLLDNAATFSEDAKPITLRAYQKGTKVAIEVHNFGSAIPQDVQDLLFQRFWYGVPGKRYVAHTGLGLYLCHSIAQMHRGRITCQSTDSAGTTITVILPRHDFVV